MYSAAVNKNIIYWMLTILIYFLITGCSQVTDEYQFKSINLEIKDGAYYINGEKTFINALGYEIGARPGQHPYEDKKKLEIARMQNDLRVIKKAGFNAIRTWSELTEKEVETVQKSGLMLIYGIWILPNGDFGDQQFMADAKQQVKDVVVWSKNYDCIITYLIMNEPMVSHIHDVGAQNTFELWRELLSIIHEEHPGIPVSISNNSAIGEYLNERIFDVYGYNTYDYDEGLSGYIQGFSNHFNYLKELNGENKPLLVTEFGLSVSPTGWGKMYGGNTLKKQADHIIKNLGELLDSDVAGVCPFYYADGWWKAGNPEIHDPYPEEWFGYWGYADKNDTIGYPRPIWHELKKYNQAIIASPRNHKIYQGVVPVEFYLNNQVSRAKIIHNDKVIFDKQISNYHFTDQIEFDERSITDRELIIEFYNREGKLLKWEAIMILTAKDIIDLPEIRLDVNTSDLNTVNEIKATITVRNDTIFKLDNNLRYLFSPHEGWDPGEHRTKIIDTNRAEYSFSDSYKFSEKCLVMTVGAGLDIRYGKFVKTIHDQKIIYRGDWANPVKVD